MCDICSVSGSGESTATFVLTKTGTLLSAHTGGSRITIFSETVIGRVQGSVCERCYRHKTDSPAYKAATEQKGLLAPLRLWFLDRIRPTKEYVLASLAFMKLLQMYPEIAGRMNSGSVFGLDGALAVAEIQKHSMGLLRRLLKGGPLYIIWTPEAWEKHVKRMSETGGRIGP